MAADTDLRRLKAGIMDLSHGDFQSADLSNMNLAGRNFSGSNFQGAKLSGADCSGANFSSCPMAHVIAEETGFEDVNFTHAFLSGAKMKASRFRDARFQGVIVHTDFTQADFRGADFSGANFQQGNVFQGAIFDSTTHFDNTQIMRAAAEEPLFSFYSFVDGKLVRRPGGAQISSAASMPLETIAAKPSTDSNAKTAIARRIAAQPNEYRATAGSLVVAIRQEIDRLQNEKPNDPSALEKFNSQIDFLTEMARGLSELDAAIAAADAAEQPTDRKEGFARVADVVMRVGGSAIDWIDSNAPAVGGFVAQTALIGVACSFLMLCGAPAVGALAVPALILSGRKPADWLNSKNKD